MLKLLLRRCGIKGTKPTVSSPAAAGELAQGELWLNNNHETPGLFARADDDTLIEFTPEKLFLQDGTDAKPRSVANRLKDTISVKDFGAVGDGVADDTRAIQAAINAARTQRGAVYFPPNKAGAAYKTTAPLTCDGPISIIGAGPQAVTIMATGLAAGQFILDFDLPAATNYWFDIHGLTLRSDNRNPSGLRLKNASYCSVSSVWVYHVIHGSIIAGTNCFSNYFRNFAVGDCGGNGVRFEGFTGGGNYTFIHCNFNGNIGCAVDAASGISQLAFISCNFEQCTTNSFAAVGDVQGLTFEGCRTEGLDGGRDFLINPAVGKSVTGLSITGCYFTTDAGNSVPIEIGGAGGKVRGFSICGNHVGYAAIGSFVGLNGDGESGLIAGNYFSQATTTPVSVKRPGVIVYGNENATGKCLESWGNATWAVEEGSFSPGWQGTTTTGNALPRYNNGYYRRTGNMVTVWIHGDYVLDTATTKPAGQVRIAGLPFVSAAEPVHVEFPVTAARVAHSLPIFGQVTSGTTSILLFQEAAASTDNPAVLDWSSVRDPYGSFSMQFSYRV